MMRDRFLTRVMNLERLFVSYHSGSLETISEYLLEFHKILIYA